MSQYVCGEARGERLAPMRLLNLAAVLALPALASTLSLGGGLSRRQCLAAATYAMPFAARAADDAQPETVVEPAPAVPARTTITYAEMKGLLIECKDGDECTIKSVAFTSANGETADAILTSGERLPIIGIPEDNPSNDSSPLQLAAKLRDAGVPYSFPFSDLLRKTK